MGTTGGGTFVGLDFVVGTGSPNITSSACCADVFCGNKPVNISPDRPDFVADVAPIDG